MEYEIKNKWPVILVHGFVGHGHTDKIEEAFPHFGYAASDGLFQTKNSQKVDGVDVYRASPGPVSSYHDRACEVAAQIKGTRVDYGEEHSAKYGHNRYGEDYTGRGFCPNWSEENPVHLVGYSAGGPTSLVLQKMLEEDRFGWGSNSRWIKSISGIKAAWNGSPVAYVLGAAKDLNDKNSPGGLNLKSIPGWLLSNTSYYLATILPIIRNFYDIDLWQWVVKWKKEETLTEYFKRVGMSPLGRNHDHIGVDLSLQGAQRIAKDYTLYEGTKYFSYMSSETSPSPWNKKQYIPEFNMNIMFWYVCWRLSFLTKDKEFEKHLIDTIPGWGEGPLTLENLSETDGCLPTNSQNYPWIDKENSHEKYYGGTIIDNDKEWKDKTWYANKIEDFVGGRWDHLDLIAHLHLELLEDNKLTAPSKQGERAKKFWKQFYRRLASL